MIIIEIEVKMKEHGIVKTVAGGIAISMAI